MPNSPLSLEQYAAATAHVAHFTAEGMRAVLKQLGVASGTWQRSSEHWLAALQEEFDDPEAPIATWYGAAFSAAKAKLEEDLPKLEDVKPLHHEPADTTEPFGVAALEDPALPFRGSPPAAPPPMLAALEITSDEMGMTTTVPALDVPDEALPFAPAPNLSLAQYASLQAELARSPSQKQTIVVRYGIRDTEMLRTVETSWTRRLVANEAERTQYDELFASYTEWLVKGSPR